MASKFATNLDLLMQGAQTSLAFKSDKKLSEIQSGIDELVTINAEALQLKKIIKDLTLESARQLSNQTQQLTDQTLLLRSAAKEKELEKIEQQRVKRVRQIAFEIREELSNIVEDESSIQSFLRLEEMEKVVASAGVSPELVDDFQDKKYVKDCLDDLSSRKLHLYNNVPAVTDFCELRDLNVRSVLANLADGEDIGLTEEQVQETRTILLEKGEKFERGLEEWKEDKNRLYTELRETVSFLKDYLDRPVELPKEPQDPGLIKQTSSGVARVFARVWLWGIIGITSLLVLVLFFGPSADESNSSVYAIVLFIAMLGLPAWNFLRKDKQKSVQRVSEEKDLIESHLNYTRGLFEDAEKLLDEKLNLRKKIQNELSTYNQLAMKFNEIADRLKDLDKTFPDLVQGRYPIIDVEDLIR